MVACMEEAHPKRVPRPVSYYIRNDIFDYLFRVIIGAVEVSFIPLVVYFTVGDVIWVCGVYDIPFAESGKEIIRRPCMYSNRGGRNMGNSLMRCQELE